MVPASLRIRRDETKAKPRPKAPDVGVGFGLAPVSKPAPAPLAAVACGGAAGAADSAVPLSTDSKYFEFLQTMNELGAFE